MSSLQSFAVVPSALVSNLRIAGTTINEKFIFDRIVANIHDILPDVTNITPTLIVIYGTDGEVVYRTFCQVIQEFKKGLCKIRSFKILNHKTLELSALPATAAETVLSILKSSDARVTGVLFLPEVSGWEAEFFRNPAISDSALADLLRSEMPQFATLKCVSITCLTEGREAVLGFSEVLKNFVPPSLQPKDQDALHTAAIRKLQKEVLEKDLARIRVLEHLEMIRASLRSQTTELETTMREKLRLEKELLETEERRLMLAQNLLDVKEENILLKETQVSERRKCQQIQDELDDAKGTIARLEGDRDSLIGEIDRLSRLLKETESKLADSEDRVAKQLDKTKILSCEILRLAENNVQLEKESRILKQKDELEISENAEERIRMLQSEVSDLKTENLTVAKLKQELSLAEKEKQETMKALAYTEDLLEVERSAIHKLKQLEIPPHSATLKFSDIPTRSENAAAFDSALAKLVAYADEAKKSELASRKRWREAELAVLWLRQQFVTVWHDGTADERVFQKIKAGDVYQPSADSEARLIAENERLRVQLEGQTFSRQLSMRSQKEPEKIFLLENAVRELEKERAALLVRATIAEEQVKALTAGLKKRGLMNN